MRVQCIVGSILLMAGAASATPVVFSVSSGTRAASASFDVVAGNLVVTLTNTSSYDVLVPVDVLTALFFDIPGVGPLTPVSATLSGSTVFFGSNGGGNVGGEWDYESGFSGPGSASEGISSSGFGLFGDGNFNGPDLDPPTAVNGLNYGLLSTGDDTATGNAPVTGGMPLTQDHTVFTLSGIPGNFDPSALGAILRVSFQYGTGLEEPNIPFDDVPLPGVGAMATIGLLGLSIRRRRSV